MFCQFNGALRYILRKGIAMVGKWYNEYRTPKDLRKDKVIITIVAFEIQKEYEVKDEG